MAGHIEDRHATVTKKGLPRKPELGCKRWRARTLDPNRKPVCKSFDRKVDAERWLRKVEGSKDEGRWVSPKGGRTKFVDHAAKVMANKRNSLRSSSFDRDESYLRNHVLPTFGKMQLAQITRSQIQAWVKDLSEKGLAPRTVKECYRIVGSILRDAAVEKLIGESPAVKVKLPRIPKSNRRFLTEEEVRILADSIDPRYRTLILAGGYLGLRWSELAGLRWSAVNLDEDKVRVEASIERVGNGYRFTEELKNDRTRRTILMPPFLTRLMREEKMRSTSDYVFSAPGGGFLRYHSFRTRVWNPAVKESGLGSVTPHELRHSHVSWLIRDGWTEHEIVVRMGWETSMVLSTTYGHLYEAQERERISKLGSGEQGFGDGVSRASYARPGAVSALPTRKVEDAV